MKKRDCAQTGSHPVHLDQGRLVGDGLGASDRVADPLNVGVAVHDVLHVPAGGGVASANILSEGDVGVACETTQG